MKGTVRLLMYVTGSTALLQVSCPAGIGKFLAPVVQPIIGQALTQLTSAFTTTFIDIVTQLLNQIFGTTPA